MTSTIEELQGARAAREAEEAPGLLRRAGSFIAEHPKATAGAALGTLGALGGGYALHRHLKNKAENDNQEQKAASIYSSFFDEAAKIAGFDKEASTRYAREAEKAVETGDRGMLNAIAGAHSQLGLPDRDVTWLGRGGEGSAHLRLGTHPSLPDEKMHVVKYYDPASNVSRGQATTDLLEAKQVATKAMQEEAAKRGGKVIVPSMGSFETKQTPVGLRHRSFHQYLPDIDQEASKRMVDQSTDAMIGAIEGTMNKDPKQVVRSLVGMRNQNLEDVHSVLQGAGKQTGTDVGDVILGRSPLGLQRRRHC